jgi:hypothetical protein
LPDASDGVLLERYRPRLFVARSTEGPIDFHADYVAHGLLTDGAGNAVPVSITRDALNRRKTDPRAVFVHRSGDGTAFSYPGNAPATPVMYGRVDRETFELGGLTRHFTFLTCHGVFRTSGIGAGIAGWKGAALGIAGRRRLHVPGGFSAKSACCWAVPDRRAPTTIRSPASSRSTCG